MKVIVFTVLTSFTFASEGLPKRVTESQLPIGKGLASRFVADHGIQKASSVIFADNFESGSLGERWDEKAKPLTLVASGGGVVGNQCLRVTATLGQDHGGGLTKWFQSSETVFVRFYTRFDQCSDYIHHFVTLRANQALRGKEKWSGFGGAGVLPRGDERFSTALEPWGDWGRIQAPGHWNFYSYWHEMKPSGDQRFWGNQFLPKGQDSIKKGQWICAELMLKHNTPGQRNGEQAFWIGGELLGHWNNISWRTNPSLWANALTLESYVTDRWTKNPVNIVDFDNVVIASEYIGPAGKP